MPNFNCKMCGGQIKYDAGDRVVTCEYCGSTQTISSITDERKVNLFNRANALRLKSEFDKALATYETILLEFPNDAEAHWGLCLCKYGIEYVDDVKTGKKIPTCHRTLFQSIFDDIDYKDAINNSDVITREIYEAEAKYIDSIQKRIIETSQREEPYDIFICYKETDENGQRTKDSVLAQDIYNRLVNDGYRVFFSRITLETKLGKEFEPIIFAALRSAKVMLSIGTKAEYFNSPWVKNEWSRYLSFMKDDKDKYLIPCYSEMDPYDMPEEFAMLQAQDMNKIGFIQDLSYGISKIIKKQQVVTGKVSTIKNSHIDNLIKRVDLALEDRDYSQASKLIEDILNEDAECAIAYLYRIVISNGLTSLEDLNKLEEPLVDDKNYSKALRFADDSLRQQIEGYNNSILRNIKLNEQLSIYNKAIESMQNERYAQAISYFNSIIGFRDCKEQIDRCNELINALREEKYLEASKLIDDFKFSEAIDIFSSIIDYKDSKEKIELATSYVETENQYQKAKKYLKDDNITSYNKAIECLSKITDYRDSEYLISKYKSRIEEIKTELKIEREKRKKKIKTSLIIASAVISLFAFIYFLIIPATKYAVATSKIRNHDYESAERILKTISGYFDSEKQIALNESANYVKSGSLVKALGAIERAEGEIVIKYDTNGGNEIDEIRCLSSADYDKVYRPLAMKEGYVFNEWIISQFEVDTAKKTIRVVLNANYDLINYQIYYNLNSGYFDSSQDVVNEYNVESHVEIPTPSRRGYTFIGWIVNDTFVPGDNYVFPENTIDNQELIAMWEANLYTITYDADGGKVEEATMDVYYDSYYSIPQPTREGYTFGGWYYGNRHFESGTYYFDSDIIVVARWTIDTFLINYELNGGVNNTSNKTEYTFEEEVTLNEPTRAGYSFVGWTTAGQDEPSIEMKIEHGSTGDVTFVANWSANSYNVSFNVNCDDVSSVSDIKVTYDAECDLPTLSRTGYEFVGWYKDDARFEDGKWTTPYDVNLTAKWQIVSYSITYNLDGGTNNSANKLTYTVEDSLNIVEPSRAGYSFAGWNKSGSSLLQNTITIQKGTTGNIVINANWTANTYNCSLNVNGGNTLVETEYEFLYDANYSLPTPTKTGYSFTGWYYNNAQVTSKVWSIPNDATLIAKWSPRNDIKYVVNHYQQNIEDDEYTLFETDEMHGVADSSIDIETKEYYGFLIPVTLNRTIKADGSLVVDYYYQRNVYDISFVCNGGDSIEPKSFKYGASIESYVATRTGYTFGGWYSDINLSNGTVTIDEGATKSLHLYAWWTEETKTSSFGYELNGDNYSITSFKGSENNVNIPTFINDKAVNRIIDLSSSSISELRIPGSVQYIEKGSLACGNLEKLVTPFVGNTRMSQDDISLSNYTNGSLGFMFGNDSFLGGEATNQNYNGNEIIYHIPISLTEVIVYDSSYIVPCAFLNCKNIRTIEITNATTKIGGVILGGCTSLEKLSIPFVGNEPQIDDDVYGSPLGSIFGSQYSGEIINQVYYPLGETTSSNSNFNIPSSFKEIVITGDSNIVCGAFYNCSMIETITITGNAKIVGKYAFHNCNNLKHVELPDSIEKIGTYCFEDCGSIQTIELPLALSWLGGYAFRNCSSLINIVIPDNVAAVGNYTFSGCDNLIEVELGDGIKVIGDYAFRDCSSLMSISMPDNLTSIGNGAFYECINLANVIVPSYVVSIGASAFTHCRSLTIIIIPSSVSSIGSFAFKDCYNLTIHCKTYSKPDGWSDNWNPFGCPVVWGSKELN